MAPSIMAKSVLTLLLLPFIVCGQQIPVIDRATFTSLKMSIPGKIVLEEHIGTSIFNISYTVPYFDLTDEIPYTTTAYQEDTKARLYGSTASIELRIKEMDAANISTSVLSLTGPGVQGDQTASIYKTGNHSSRFEFWCQVAFQDATAAVTEAERCVKDLGGIGIWSNGYTNNNSVNASIYLDHPMYAVFWAKLQELNVPLYIHPREPVPQAQVSYEGFEFLAGSTLGFSTETMTHALRIMLAGTLDKYPDVKVVIGHCGEGLPFFLERMKQRMRHMHSGQWQMKYDLQHYWLKNFWITSSGIMSLDTLTSALNSIGPSRVMFSVDYPFEDDAEQSGWFGGLELPQDLKDQIVYGNAMELFGWTNKTASS